MRLNIQQKAFSFRDRFFIRDEAGRTHYSVEGEVFTWGKRLHLYDAAGRECAFLHQKAFSLLPTFFVERDGEEVARIVKHFTFFSQEYDVEGPGWTVEGDFTAHDYEISCGGMTVARVHKRWFNWGDCYEAEFDDGADAVLIVCAVLVIDCVLAAAAANN